jgi:hypothetical protein
MQSAKSTYSESRHLLFQPLQVIMGQVLAHIHHEHLRGIRINLVDPQPDAENREEMELYERVMRCLE